MEIWHDARVYRVYELEDWRNLSSPGGALSEPGPRTRCADSDLMDTGIYKWCVFVC